MKENTIEANEIKDSIAKNSLNPEKNEDGSEKLVEALTIFRGTIWTNTFDGYVWDDSRSEEEHEANPHVENFTFDDLVEMEANSIVDAKERQLQTAIDPSRGISVNFKNPDSDQAKRFQLAVDRKAEELWKEYIDKR